MSVEYEVEQLKKEWDVGPFYYPDYKNNPEKISYWWDNNYGEIHFENDRQKAIWLIIQGQLSDGHWENRNVDWTFWARLKPIVDNLIGWKTNTNYIPTGEWPVDLWELDDFEILVEIRSAIQEFLNLNDYSPEGFRKDLQKVMNSMGTSIRKIGYIE